MLPRSSVQIHKNVTPFTDGRDIEGNHGSTECIHYLSTGNQLWHFTPSMTNDVRKKDNSLFQDIYILTKLLVHLEDSIANDNMRMRNCIPTETVGCNNHVISTDKKQFQAALTKPIFLLYTHLCYYQQPHARHNTHTLSSFISLFLTTHMLILSTGGLQSGCAMLYYMHSPHYTVNTFCLNYKDFPCQKHVCHRENTTQE
jgi:hypothetical protein